MRPICRRSASLSVVSAVAVRRASAIRWVKLSQMRVVTVAGMRSDAAASEIRSRIASSDSMMARSRTARSTLDRRSSFSRRRSGCKVVPFTNSVNTTKPVASTATKCLTSSERPVFSLTARAKASETAPRRPPQRITSL
jgi:hypothetical protein